MKYQKNFNFKLLSIISKSIFNSLLSLFSFWHTYYTSVFTFDVAPEVFKILLFIIFFSLLFQFDVFYYLVF